jgi:hypothetical protein
VVRAQTTLHTPLDRFEIVLFWVLLTIIGFVAGAELADIVHSL